MDRDSTEIKLQLKLWEAVRKYC